MKIVFKNSTNFAPGAREEGLKNHDINPWKKPKNDFG